MLPTLLSVDFSGSFELMSLSILEADDKPENSGWSIVDHDLEVDGAENDDLSVDLDVDLSYVSNFLYKFLKQSLYSS